MIDGLTYKEDVRHKEPNRNQRRRAQFKMGWKAALVGKSIGPKKLRKELTWNNLGYRIGKLLGPASPELIELMYDLCVVQQKAQASSS